MSENKELAGEFNPAAVVFKNASGETTALRPDIEALRQQAAELRKNGPKHRFPLDANGLRTIPSNGPSGRNDTADDAGLGARPSPYAAPYIPPPPVRASEPERPDHPANDPRVGYGPDPERIGGHQGFKVA